MKAQIILLAAILFVGVSNLKAENKEGNKETKTSMTTSISGTITDAATGESLVGVKVVLEELNQVAYTDFDGNFEFDQVNNGVYTVSTDYVSYKEKEALSVDTNSNNNVSIALKADK